MKAKKDGEKRQDQEFLVTWELHAFAKSHKDAAKCALDLLLAAPWRTEIFSVKCVQTEDVRKVRVVRPKITLSK